MSSFFRIAKHNGGDILEVPARTLAQLLAKPTEVGRLFRELGYDNEVDVELKDGTATIRRSPHKRQPIKAQPAHDQQLLRLPQPELPTQEYLADVQLKFVMPAQIRCRGHSKHHVEETIKDVVRGYSGVPRDFVFQVLPDELSALLGRMQAGDVTAVADVHVTNVSPYYLLTDGRRA